MLAWLKKNPAKMLPVGEHVGLLWQVCAARVDEVDARQVVLLRDFLRAEVLLDGHGVVRAPLDGRVVGDDHALDPLDAPDARHDARRRNDVVVHAVAR